MPVQLVFRCCSGLFCCQHSPGTYLSTALSTVSTLRLARLPSRSIFGTEAEAEVQRAGAVLVSVGGLCALVADVA